VPAAIAAAGACARTVPLPPALIEARRLFDVVPPAPERLARAFEHYQRVAASAPEGPLAGEVAFALGMIAFDLHVLSRGPFLALGEAPLRAALERIRIPVTDLMRFAHQVLTAARDRVRGARRRLTEGAMELALVRQHFEELLVALARAPHERTPMGWYATLQASAARHRELIRTGLPEVAERASILYVVSALELLRVPAAPCAIAAHLSKVLLSQGLDPDREERACAAELAEQRPRLARAAWVKLEEFALDRPKSRFAPVVHSVLRRSSPRGG
jgi:hypothetical protein